MSEAEFSHILTLSDVAHGKKVTLSADADARAAIAARLGLIALDQFAVEAEVHAIASGIAAKGHVKAKLVQACAATGLPVPGTINESFDLRFLRDVLPGEPVEEEEIELTTQECDLLPLDGDVIDLGEAAVQTLSLALDPFPRHLEADSILAEKGVLNEQQTGPFAALAALRDKKST